MSSSLEPSVMAARNGPSMSIAELFSVGRSTIYRALEQSARKQESRPAPDHIRQGKTTSQGRGS